MVPLTEEHPPGSEVQPPVGSGGVFITKGMTLSLRDLSITISDDGTTSGTLKLEVANDVTPHWLEIALAHAEAAVAANALVLARAGAEENEDLGKALEAEFTSSMQACVASGIALDAFYARVKDNIVLPTGLVERWRIGRVARHAQVAEVLRRSFRVHQSKVTQLKHFVREIYSYRDRAVHPTAAPTEPVRRPDLNLGLEWRFAAFRAYNARILAKLTISLISQVAEVPRARYPDLARYCDGLKPRSTRDSRLISSEVGQFN